MYFKRLIKEYEVLQEIEIEKIIRDGVFREYLATENKREKTNNHGMER
ncbi:hypothetical protein [Cetobacterium sp.]